MENSFTAWGMLRQLFSDASPGRQFLFLIVLMGTCLTLVSFIGMVLAAVLFQMPFAEVQALAESGFQNSPVSLVRYFQGVQTVGLFLLPALLANCLFLRTEDSFKWVRQHQWGSVLAMLVVLMTTGMPLMEKLISWNASVSFPEKWSYLEQHLRTMEDLRNQLSQNMLASASGLNLLINIAIMAILPAVAEEFLFRGVLQPLFGQWFRNVHVSIWVVAAIFSAIHMQFFGFIPRLVLGGLFGYLYFWSRTIWVPVLAHFINNLIAVGFAFWIAVQGQDKFSGSPVFTSWLTLVFSGIVVFLVLKAIRKKFQKALPTSMEETQ